MNILIAAAAFIVGILITAAAFIGVLRTRTPAAKKRKGQPEKVKSKRKIEFSKLILALVLLTYFAGVGVGIKIAFIDYTQLGVVLAFIGTPTSAAIAFYAWKAKAENIIKIKNANPKATEGVPVDLNNIIT